MERILVTGATGFLGGAVVRALRRAGADVVATGRDPTKCADLARQGIATLCRDLAEPFDERETAALRDVRAVVHCAALSAPFGRPAAFERANVHATAHLVDLATRLGVRRFVHVSTPAVYFRFRDQIGLAETTPLPEPVNDYARTKRAAEAIVTARPEIGPVVLRPRGIYGAGDTALLPRLTRAVAAGPLPLFRDGTAATDITHVDDVVAAVLAALTAPNEVQGEIFNVSGGVGLPIRRIVETVCDRLSLTPRWRALPIGLVRPVVATIERAAKLLPGTPEPRVTVYGLGIFAHTQTLDISKAERLLGWTPRVSFEDGLARTFDHSLDGTESDA